MKNLEKCEKKFDDSGKTLEVLIHNNNGTVLETIRQKFSASELADVKKITIKGPVLEFAEYNKLFKMVPEALVYQEEYVFDYFNDSEVQIPDCADSETIRVLNIIARVLPLLSEQKRKVVLSNVKDAFTRYNFAKVGPQELSRIDSTKLTDILKSFSSNSIFLHSRLINILFDIKPNRIFSDFNLFLEFMSILIDFDSSTEFDFDILENPKTSLDKAKYIIKVANKYRNTAFLDQMKQMIKMAKENDTSKKVFLKLLDKLYILAKDYCASIRDLEKFQNDLKRSYDEVIAELKGQSNTPLALDIKRVKQILKRFSRNLEVSLEMRLEEIQFDIINYLENVKVRLNELPIFNGCVIFESIEMYKKSFPKPENMRNNFRRGFECILESVNSLVPDFLDTNIIIRDLENAFNLIDDENISTNGPISSFVKDMITEVQFEDENSKMAFFLELENCISDWISYIQNYGLSIVKAKCLSIILDEGEVERRDIVVILTILKELSTLNVKYKFRGKEITLAL